MADGQVVFEIEGDTKGIKDALKETTNAIDKESQKWDTAGKNAANNIGDSFTSMFKKISAAAIAAKIGQTLLNIGKDAIRAASDLAEVQNVVDVTFGASSKEIDKWAQNAIKQYGLTETQAKRYTSTIGAMMKSMGMSGEAVTQMSEDLAGLAADMASFYNLDFDTAFAKIRSGISGETEPLKQLGINMSQANLEAFALQKGIEKTWKEMSSSEQAMIRYQYLMEATADAQGDFARTTDGVANGTRLLESELETLKTKLGGPLQEAFAGAIGFVNELIGKLIPEKEEERHTILDDLAEIDLKTDTKVQQIKDTATEARALLTVYQEIAAEKTVPTSVGEIADNANKLKSATASSWTKILKSFQDANFSGIGGDSGRNIKELADGLSGIKSGSYKSKAEAWNALLGILWDNVGVIEAYTGKSPDDIKAFLTGIGNTANTLDDDSGTAWASLLSSLATYLGPNLIDEETVSVLSGNLSGIEVAGNRLKQGTGANWTHFLTALQSINGLENVFGEGETAKQNIEDLAAALSGNGINGSKASAWKKMIDALLASDQIGTLSDDKLEALKQELTDIGEAASYLQEDDVDGWNALFTRLVETVDESGATGGTRLIDILAGSYEGFAAAAEAAETAQEELGDAAGDTADRQTRLLNVSQQMIRMIPALADAFDEQTGELKKTDAEVRKIIDDWEQYEVWTAKYRGAKEKAEAVEADTANVEETATTADSKRAKLIAELRKAGKSQEEAMAYANRVARMGEFGWGSFLASEGADAGKYYTPFWFGKVARGEATYDARGTTMFDEGKAADAWLNPSSIDDRHVRDMMFSFKYQTDDVRNAVVEYYTALYDASEAAYSHGVAVETVTAEVKQYEDAADKMAEATEVWTVAETEAVDALMQKYAEALQVVQEYYDTVRQGVETSVKSTIQGFKKIETASQKAKDNTKADATEEGMITGDGVSVGSMRSGLQSQLDYMREYQELLAAAKKAGFSDEVIAALSDGSTESFDYLSAMFTRQNGELVKNFTQSDVDEINKLYEEVGNEREKFVDDLTAKQLACDDTWKELNKTVDEAANNMTTKIKELGLSTSGMMTSMIDGINKKAPELAQSVSQVKGMLDYLESHGITAPTTGGLTFGTVVVSGDGSEVDGSFASGLNRVPFDGFIAKLHKDEAILPAEEADLYRSGEPGMDYASMISDMGGDVYLDGRIVGRVISERQANSYRQLERSGWRA